VQRKIAVITVKLVEESIEEPNEKIEEEIRKELEERPIPWIARVEKVTVLEVT